MADALDVDMKDKSSKYANFECKNGNVVTIRISDHNATSSNLDINGQNNAISIVVTNKNNIGIINDGNAHIVEYYYNAIKLRKAEGKPLADIVGAIKQALYSGEFKDPTGLAERQEVNMPNSDENVLYSLRQKPEPEKKGTGYKVFVLGKDGKLYPPMVANPNGAATPVGVWLDADAAPVAGESKTGRPQVKQGGKGTQGGSGKLAYRPGWHLGVIPYAIQFNRKDAEGNKTLFPKNFVFAEVEYAADKDYQDEAHAEGINSNGKYQHSLAGLKHLPTDGYYMYRTNPNPETDPWVITGAMKVNRLLTRAEQADIVRKAGREPQKIQEGDIVTDDVVNSINQEIESAPKFSLRDNQGNPLNQDGTLKLEKIKSVDELTDEDFLHPTRNVELPSLPKKIADAIGTEGKPVIIKKNIFERNYMRHKDVTPELSKKIFKSALYNPDLYGQNQKKTRPYNWVLINTKDEKGNNRTVLLEVNPNKDNVEIVHWHFIDERGLKKIRKQVDREDGQLLILPSDKEEVGALSDPTVNLSDANIANPSETSKGNAEKFSLRLQDAINETDTEPTEAQKKSGNYKKGHVKFGGYDYTIENPKGSYRSGVDENGKEWKQKMNDTYGYIRGKFGKDGDHLDMFINDKADLDSWNGDVFVVDQVNQDGTFDEHKVMYGYGSLDEAKKAYLSNYEKGWTGLGNITPVSKAGFDKWLDKSNRKLKPFADYADITSKTNMDTAPSSFEEFLEHPAVEEKASLKDADRKQTQLDIILKTNPMLDDYHTGIRKVEDIKTLGESVEEARSEAEKYGDDEWSAYPDITNDMLQNALETGEITIYSSKPIKNGVFVTPSYMQASDYAGGGNVYEKTVPLTDVAWINTDEGQYAKVDGERYSVKGVNAQSLFDAIHILYTKGKTIASQLFNMTYFDVAETPDFMKRLGLTGDKFTIRYGVISRHFGKDNQHDFTEEEWKQMPKALSNPILITEYYQDEQQKKQKGYRLYTPLKLSDGSYVVLSAEVKNAGRNLEINAINTIFGRNAISDIHDRVVYQNPKITPEQSSLLNGNNPHQYPNGQESSVANVENSSESAKNNEEKYSLRVDRYRDELNQWKKDNNLPKDAERPQLPVREPNDRLGFA